MNVHVYMNTMYALVGLVLIHAMIVKPKPEKPEPLSLVFVQLLPGVIVFASNVFMAYMRWTD